MIFRSCYVQKSTINELFLYATRHPGSEVRSAQFVEGNNWNFNVNTCLAGRDFAK